jgi:hypothetical protein
MTAILPGDRNLPLIEKVDTLVDQSINAMSLKELKSFEKKRKKIMADAERRAKLSDPPHG